MAVGAVLAALPAVLLSGCGTATEPSPAEGRDSADPSSSATRWRTYGADVDGISVTDGGNTLTLQARVPSGAPDCWRNLRAEITPADSPALFISALVESPSDTQSGCRSSESVDTSVKLPTPLTAGRSIVVNNSTHFVVPDAAAPTLVKCDDRGCPTKPSCTNASYAQAERDADTPAHSFTTTRACDDTWLIMDISTPAGGACGPDSSACPTGHVTRWLFRAGPTGWRPVGTTNEPGCTPLQPIAPALPASLCAKLPPVQQTKPTATKPA